jgi:hypothetical protein
MRTPGRPRPGRIRRCLQTYPHDRRAVKSSRRQHPKTRYALTAADPCVVVAGQLCINMQAGPLSVGAHREQEVLGASRGLMLYWAGSPELADGCARRVI